MMVTTYLAVTLPRAQHQVLSIIISLHLRNSPTGRKQAYALLQRETAVERSLGLVPELPRGSAKTHASLSDSKAPTSLPRGSLITSVMVHSAHSNDSNHL